MSEATRSIAMQYAVAYATKGSVDDLIVYAEEIHAFIVADATPGVKTPAAAPAKAPAKVATPAKETPAAAPAATPAKKKTPAKVVEPELEPEADAEPEAEDGSDVTKEEVGAAIEVLLNADMRTQAVKLFAKYGAKSLSGVKPEDYAAIKQDAEDLALNA